MSNVFRTALFAVLLLAIAAPAVAQDVVQLNEEGIAAFSSGRFEEAAQKFQQAYAINAEAPLKKNEALAWFKANKCPEALVAAKTYLSLNTADELSNAEAKTVAVKCSITKAESELAAGSLEASKATLAEAGTFTPGPDEQQKIVALQSDVDSKMKAREAERQQAAAAAAEAARRQEEEQNRGQSDQQMLGLGVAAGGGAIIVGTLVYHLAMALGTAPKFKDAAEAGDRAEYDKLGKRLETANWLVPTLYGLGVATAGVGGYLWWNAGGLESDSGTTATLPFESMGVTVTWSFK